MIGKRSKLNGNLVMFAAFKGHIGFYPNPSAIKAFEHELATYRVAKGSVQFPLDKPVPFDLVKKIVVSRMKETLEKGKGAHALTNLQPALRNSDGKAHSMKKVPAKLAAQNASSTKGRIRFRTTILQAGKTATGIRVPDEVIERLGSGKRPAVRITINGYTYRSTVAVMGGKFMVGVNAENREKAKAAGGDKVDVDIELDTEPREVTLPADFAAALNRHVKARQQFDGLSYSKKKVFVQGIEGAKTAETRQRRIDKAIGELREDATQR